MTPAAPVLVMVGGPNGSGKTTLIRALRAAPELSLPDYYINADELQRRQGLDDRGAQKLAETLRWEAIRARRSLMYETVMSHPSKIAELQAAALAGYRVTVVFVATEDPQVNIERIALRVADGGHDVPKERIRARHRRSIALAPSAIAFAAHAYVYDNTAWGTAAAQQLQAALVRMTLQPTVATPRPWVAQLIATANERAAELEDICRAGGDRTAVAFPNLLSSTAEGPLARAATYFGLQVDGLSGKTLVHDKALLPTPVRRGQSYRIEYAHGVAKVTRRAGATIRAVAAPGK